MNEHKMSFETFVEMAKAGIKSYLPEAYRDADISVKEMKKLNESYLGMTVAREGQTAVPNINLTRHYQEYLSGGSLEQTFSRMAEQAQMEMPGLSTGWLQDYEQVKQHLFIRVNDAKENEAFLSMSPHRETDGLAVSYHIAFTGLSGVEATTPVSHKMLEMYGITAEQLHADALENSKRMFPAVYKSMAEIMMGIASEMGVEADMMPPMEGPQLMVLTNDQGVHGAGSLFYPGQMEEIGAQMGSDFFVLPSSVHEVLIFPDDGQTDYRDLQMMVQQINEAEVAPADRLSDHVYHYDVSDHVLEKAETFEHRMEEKEKLQQQAAETGKHPDKERMDSKGHDRRLRDEDRKPERKSVLQRLNEKKEQVKAQPKKDTPNRHRGAALE